MLFMYIFKKDKVLFSRIESGTSLSQGTESIILKSASDYPFTTRTVLIVIFKITSETVASILTQITGSTYLNPLPISFGTSCSLIIIIK